MSPLAFDPGDATLWAETLIHSRHTTRPKRLLAPGPTAEQQAALLRAAAAAPDHDRLLPWRLVDIPDRERGALGEAFAQALQERDPHASPAELQQARDKAHRAPWLLLCVVRVRGGPAEIPAAERLLSAGAALQNMLLTATAMGLGSALTSGKALQSRALRGLFRLHDDEDATCFLSVGQVSQDRPPPPRPPIDTYYSRLA